MDWTWVGSNAEQIWGRVLEHVALAAPPIVIGFLISVPLGYVASRSRVWRAILVTTGNILFTIPSIALLVLVPVVLGRPLIDPINVVVALTIYAIAIMVRSAADAFVSVAADVKQSATAIGYSRVQRFFRVELPLAGPVLLAGVRVVSVSTVSLVSVGAITGVNSLGILFTDAFRNNNVPEAVTGIVMILVIAGVFDLVLSLIGRVLMPWTRRSPSPRRPVIVREATS